MQQFNPIGQPQERDLNSLKYINNLDEMEQQLTILESLGANSSNLVSSISSTPRPKILCKCGCGNLIDKYDKQGRERFYVNGHQSYKPNLIFNKEQEQIILGSLLGDGCIINSKRKHIYSEGHCKEQKDYLLWKNNYLGFNVHIINNLKNPIHIEKSNKSFKFYKDLFYINNKKIVTREILDKLEPLGLTIWYLDDGSYDYHNDSINISTHSFGLEGNQIIQQWFEDKFNIGCKIQKIIQTLNKNQQYILTLNVENTKKFIELIKPHVIQIPSMIYKIGLDEERIIKIKNKIKKYYNNPIIKKKSKEYKKLWFQKNKSRILINQKEYLRLWKIKNREEIRKKTKEDYRKNKEKLDKKHKEYYLNNKEKILQKQKEWTINNKDKIREIQRRYYQRHKNE